MCQLCVAPVLHSSTRQRNKKNYKLEKSKTLADVLELLGY